MQPVIVTTQYPDLYRFVNVLVSQVSGDRSGHNSSCDSVLIWSPEAHSSLLDNRDKLDLVENYACKLGIKVVLSAANDASLRTLAKEVGWTVLWDIPGLDQALNSDEPHFNNYQIERLFDEVEFEESLAS